MANLGKIVYLSETQKDELFENGSVTSNGTTITYNENDIYVTPSRDITDLQVNGTSIVTGGVANIPIASTSTAGVVKADAGYGVGVSSSNKLYISRAETSQIKAGTELYRAIVPNEQHISAFYALAKAAGDSTQSASSNAVGAYTDNAKIQIQKMLGIYEPPFVLLNDITLDERTCIELTADSNGTPYNLIGIFMEIYYVADLVSEASGYGRYYFYNSNNQYMTAETGRYVSSNLPSYKLLEIKRTSNLTICNYTRLTNTGNQGNWGTKTGIGFSNGDGYCFDFGNITAIKMNTNDYEPVGTQIKIWGQWAY